MSGENVLCTQSLVESGCWDITTLDVFYHYLLLGVLGYHYTRRILSLLAIGGVGISLH